MAQNVQQAKQTWPAYLQSRLDRFGWTMRDAARRSHGTLPYKTLNNWVRQGVVPADAEMALAVAALFGDPESVALQACGFQVLAERLNDPERPAAPAVDPGFRRIIEERRVPKDLQPKVLEYYERLLALAAERAEADALDLGERLAEGRTSA